ncbi:peptide chain release factor N(5)-glutamine methyltransferase [Desulfonatronovibrio hydrogenovorans]|uniref:peptide chain release factor N(5)-glutamine methyltransferase n=1 Tax=Desulfonatronovibrio hydrogenovorans TaxID=53245 RepID=UPI00048F0223|nr:peptide chain release factor N(5)-glutamine methyltransferase [Desulfonatronovibrio hydrogenovorans]
MINEGAAALEESGVDSPRLSSRLLMAHVLGCSQERLLAGPHTCLSPDQAFAFRAFLARRLAGEPVAYILGYKEFYGLDFKVDGRVLIPRPETELLVDLARDFSRGGSELFADLGTGSGALAVSIARELPMSFGLACDICPGAIAVARQNALLHGVGQRVMFFISDMGMGIKPGCLDFIFSNPPYLSESELLRVSREVSRYEPRQALVSGCSGLEHIQRLETVSRVLLKSGGMIFLEMGSNQSRAVQDIFSDWTRVSIHKDLAGHERILKGTRP